VAPESIKQIAGGRRENPRRSLPDSIKALTLNATILKTSYFANSECRIHGTGQLDLKINLDLKGPYGWKIPDRRYPCYLRYLPKSPLDIAHILSNKGKPDIVVVVSQIVMGNTGVTVHYLNKLVDLSLRYYSAQINWYTFT